MSVSRSLLLITGLLISAHCGAATYYDVDVKAHRVHLRAHVPQGLFAIEGTGDINSIAAYGNSLSHEALLINALPKDAAGDEPLQAIEARGYTLDARTAKLPPRFQKNSFIFSLPHPRFGEPKYLLYSLLPGAEENFEINLFSDSPDIFATSLDVLENFKIVSEPKTTIEIVNAIGVVVTASLVLFLVLAGIWRARGKLNLGRVSRTVGH